MKLLDDRRLKAAERLMGMLLIMLAVQMFLDGVAGDITHYGQLR